MRWRSWESVSRLWWFSSTFWTMSSMITLLTPEYFWSLGWKSNAVGSNMFMMIFRDFCPPSIPTQLKRSNFLKESPPASFMFILSPTTDISFSTWETTLSATLGSLEVIHRGFEKLLLCYKGDEYQDQLLDSILSKMNSFFLMESTQFLYRWIQKDSAYSYF